jgi:3-oxoacyl-[acyl-carrier-protein] synthase III
MLFENVSIVGVDHVDPPHRITTSELADQLSSTLTRLGINRKILEALVGIQARRFWDVGIQPSDAATMAAERVLESTGIDRDRIGIIINTSVCRDFVEPSVACIVHRNLGLSPHCINFDLGNACLAFLNGMEMVGMMIERGQIDFGLIVDGESSRFITEQTIGRLQDSQLDEREFRSQFASLTLGSGGAAMVMARRELVPEGHAYRGSVSMAATNYNHLCRGQVDRMDTDSTSLMFAGIELAGKTWQKAEDHFGWNLDQIDELVLHQVSKVHTTQLAMALKLPMSKILPIYPEYGNVGPAAVPMALSQVVKMGRVRKGNRVALMGIGSGLNCAMAEVIW